jgi:peptidyl-prolyl cis-trans isomerase SurA
MRSKPTLFVAMALASILAGNLGWLSLALQAAIIDRILAVVNGKIITLSDVERERQYLALAADGSRNAPSLPEILAKVIDQHLIRQQMEQFPGVDVSSDEVQNQLAGLRQGSPDPAEWQRQWEQTGISLAQLENHLREQLKILKFLDNRFRPFAIVEAVEIEEYYRRDFLPPLQSKKVVPPPLSEVEEKIRGVLIEQKINDQVDEWLKSLKEAATIQIKE